MAGFCPSCGSGLSGSGAFCTSCGAAQHDRSNPSQDLDAPPLRATPLLAPKSTVEEWLDTEAEDWLDADVTPPIGVLRELSREQDGWVRTLVGQRVESPLDVMRTLASDGDADVRWAVALNRNCPSDALQRLTGEDRKSVV